jgi:lysophospholipase L1-like esterase
MKKQFFLLVFVLILTTPSLAQEYPKPLDTLELGYNDTLVFLGDSITHQCLYTQYVEDYYYTRYPQSRIRFHNAGVGGDRATDALVRFQEDIASFKPKYVTILLGMNDGRYTIYDQAIFDTYKNDMTTLQNNISACGAKAILMTPTMFDMRAKRIRVQATGKGKEQLSRQEYYNGVLSLYGAWLREQAFSKGLGFVDMYSPLNNITLKERKAESKFTLIKDAVHPGAPGQLIMAYAILDNMNVSRTVSTIHLYRDEYGEWQENSSGGAVYDPQEESANSGRFTFLAESLPWVVPEEAQLGYKLVAAGKNLSREILRINGMQPGRYEVKINDESVGTYSYTELAAGVELQDNPKTPQYQQALQVALLNKERNDKAVRPLRNLWGQMKQKRRSGLPIQKPDEFTQWQKEFRKKVADLQDKAKEYENKIYQINQPKPLEYYIHKVE